MRRYHFFLGIFVALSVADLALTWRLLGSSEGGFYESNPVAQWWLQRFGWAGLAAFKAGVVLAVSAAILTLVRFRPRAAGRVLTFACLTTGAVVGYSLFLLGTHAASAGQSRVAHEDRIRADGLKLERQRQQALEYRRLLSQLGREILAGRSTLKDAVARLAGTARGQDPTWLGWLRRQHPGRSDSDCLKANLLDHLRDAAEEGSPRTTRLPRKRTPLAIPAPATTEG